MRRRAPCIILTAGPRPQLSRSDRLMPDRYLAELAEILSGPNPLVLVGWREPASYGWLRRSEFDHDGKQAWERPDGTVVGLSEEPDTSRGL